MRSCSGIVRFCRILNRTSLVSSSCENIMKSNSSKSSSSSVSSARKRTGSWQDRMIRAASGQERDRESSRSPSYSSVCLGYRRHVSQSASGPVPCRGHRDSHHSKKHSGGSSDRNTPLPSRWNCADVFQTRPAPFRTAPENPRRSQSASRAQQVSGQSPAVHVN